MRERKRRAKLENRKLGHHMLASRKLPSCYVTNRFFLWNQGAGGYVYIEASSPRLPGDTARLASPWMRGPQCMTFYYHMYGATMGCVVIYIKRQATNELKPVWLRSQDQGKHWIQGQISINETSSYQVSFKMFVYSTSNSTSIKKKKNQATCHALSPRPTNIEHFCYYQSQIIVSSVHPWGHVFWTRLIFLFVLFLDHCRRC